MPGQERSDQGEEIKTMDGIMRLVGIHKERERGFPMGRGLGPTSAVFHPTFFVL